MSNKKLSVVMAGAMLATSVAPVLADTTSSNTYEVNSSNIGLLIDRLDEYFKTAPKFTKKSSLLKESSLAEASVYAYQVREKGTATWTGSGVVIGNGTVASEGTTDTSLLKTLDLTKEYELRIIDRGHTLDADKEIVDYTDATTYTTYKKADINALANVLGKSKFHNHDNSNGVGDVSFSGNTSTLFSGLDTLCNGTASTAGTGVVVKVTDLDGKTLSKNDDNDVNGLILTLKSGKTVKIQTGQVALDFNSNLKLTDGATGNGSASDAITSDTKASEVIDFSEKAATGSGTKADIDSETLYTVNIVPGNEATTFKVTDLYDGFMLTTEGHALLSEMKTVEAKAKSTGLGEKYSVVVENKGHAPVNNKFTVTIINNGVKKVVSISGTTEESDKLATLKTWLEARKASVDILAGDNRYATAVEIAKEYALATPDVSTDKKIVLVNGEALVDGLAAAPYAKAAKAPILLTKTDSLPKETKSYLKELVSDIEVGNLKNVEVTIVGGNSVVSQNVVNELKDMGFDVKRLAGDNREQTSLAVADALAEENGSKTNAFVIGAEGEADAMSIASYAAATKTPIVVSKSAKGLSTVGLNDLSDYTGEVVIIGGEKAVPTSTEEAIKELVSDEDNVSRIAGERRQDTNAAIIAKYHNNFENVLVSKDGTNAKSQLVDALPVSIFAAANTDTNFGNKTTAAPIVLATNKVTDGQVNEIVLHRSNTMSTVYQIGGGVDKTNVLYKIVEKLKLNK